MRKDVKWTVIVVMSGVVVSKVISYVPKHIDAGEQICIVAGGKVTARTAYSGYRIPIYKHGDILLTCVTDEEEILIDEHGRYICGSNEDTSDIECFEVGTEKKVL